MSVGWRDVAELLDEVVGVGIAPSAALVVGRRDDVVFEQYRGTVPVAPASAARADAPGEPRAVREELSRDAGPETVYDLSSLTKPLATVALLARAVESGALRIDEPVVRRLPEFASDDPRRATIGIRDLLAHASGLPAHRRYFEALAAEDRTTTARGLLATRAGARRVESLAAAEPLEREPRSTALYSDVGFIVLGRIVAEAMGASLAEAFEREVAAPLGLARTGFVDLEAPRAAWSLSAAPCGRCEWRGRVIRGEVQDENAWAMGGVAGHAGLFGTAREVHRLAAEHVRAWRGERALLSRATVRELWTVDVRTNESTWALGWDTPSPQASSAGTRIGRPAVGHLGFTGTSLWIDLQRGVHVVLLTNRLEHGRDNAAIRAFRPRLHDAVLAACDAQG